MMTLEEYSTVLKGVLLMQVEYENEQLRDWGNSPMMIEHLRGIKKGLQIAIDKIDASAFLRA